MNTFLTYLGLGGGAVALAYFSVRWVAGMFDKAAEAEVLRHENETKGHMLEDVRRAKEIRERLVSDLPFASRVRKRFTRND